MNAFRNSPSKTRRCASTPGGSHRRRRPQITACTLALVLVTGSLLAACESSVSFPAGVTAPDPPRQTPVTQAPVLVRDDFVIRPVAEFALEARILGKERYRFDRSADLSPIDLALGWGSMSDQAIIDQFSISQSSRFYWWKVKQYPIPRRAIIESSANMHMIPADDDIRDQLLSLRPGSLIHLEGYLVNVTSDNFVWSTSTSRKDAGAGACEIVWVKRLDVIDVLASPARTLAQ